MQWRTLLGSHAVSSIATRVALGAFPILFVLVLRWTWGKDVFDLAAAAINWSMYLNILLLSGFAMAPPAVARLARGDGDDSSQRINDLHAVGDHIVLCRWLVAVGVVAALVLALTVDRTFEELARTHGQELRWWFLMFAVVALAQIPLTLWLGISQGLGLYTRALVLAAIPRGLALVLLPVGCWAGWSPGPVVGIALIVVLCGQWLIGSGARRALLGVDGRMFERRAKVSRVLSANLNAGLVVLVGTAVTIVPVTLVGRWIPDQVGTAHVIVSFANALAGVVVAAFFPASLFLHEALRQPGGIRAYCVRIGVKSCVFALVVVGALAILKPVCDRTSLTCQPPVLIATAMVIAGTALRLGALGTQHAAVYRGRPHLNLLSALSEASAALTLLVVLLPRIGLVGMGVALAAGGALRFALSLSVERSWLERATG